MIFSKKKKITIAYTVERCPKCKSIKKREFSKGDVLFSESSGCQSCDRTMMIEKIYGETVE